MSRYILSRLVGLVPVLFFISLITFLSVAFIPGNAAMVIAGDTATKKDLEAISKRLELDLPLHIRYVRWLGRTLTGDLGASLLTKQQVISDIARALPVTLELALLGTLFGAMIAFPIGIYAATHQGSWVDQSVMGVLLLGISIPTYALSIILILLFSVNLKVLPASGFTPFVIDPIQNLKQMVLPVTVVALFQGAILARYVRSGMLEVLGQDYVRTARSKGLGENRVILSHAMRNMLIPVITFTGLQFGALLSGLVITEEIFALPGIGRLALNSLFNRDFPVVQGVVLFVAVSVVLVNLGVDVLYSFLDPRIRCGTNE